ncbi:MAG: rhomboid family intramembrane serine protease [Gemmatimonadaceae bacterium]
MIPLSDDNPTVRLPVMTILLLAAMASVWILVQKAGFDERVLAMSICNLGLVPAELSGAAPVGTGIPLTRDLICVVDADALRWATPVISIFLHGGWAHLLGNGLFFWVFGNNIEDVMGPARFLAFFLLCGVAAAVAHILVQPASAVPTVGASGAVSGVMGAYLVLFPRVRVRMLFILLVFFKVVPVPAWAVLLWWFGLQVLMGLPALGGAGEMTGGVAVWAHVGGFVTGAVLIRAFLRHDLVELRRGMLLRRGLLRAVE